jgi:predicted DNA binding CopG/RHH family protein
LLQKKKGRHISDRNIDFSDIPESTDEELRRAVRVGRPVSGKAKQLIAIRIAPGLLLRIQKLAAKKEMPYQTLMHELLEDAVDKRAA